MFSSVQLQDWRGHEDTTVPLAGFTVLVGGNGVGKTSVLEALGDVRSGQGDQRAESIKSQIRAAAAVPRVGRGTAFVTLRRGMQVVARFLREQNSAAVHWQQRLDEPAEQRAIELALSPRRIAEPSPVTKTIPDADGYGTASTLVRLKINESERFDRVLARARRVVPTVRSLGMNLTSVEAIASETPNLLGGFDRSTRKADGYVLDVSFENAPRIPAEAVSEGTLLALGALTAIEAHEDPRLLLIDDIDRALHVEAQAEYIRILREVQKDNPKLQIVATTHSPLVVEHFTDDEVVVLGRTKAGKVVAKKLSEHPGRAKLRTLNAGEFWVAELENWVAD